jgi:hypothetical protein
MLISTRIRYYRIRYYRIRSLEGVAGGVAGGGRSLDRMRYCLRSNACAIRAPAEPHAVLHAVPHALYARPQAVCVGPTELKHVN